MAKTVVCPSAPLRVRAVNDGYILEELGKRWELGMVLEKRGKHFVQKMVV